MTIQKHIANYALAQLQQMEVTLKNVEILLGTEKHRNTSRHKCADITFTLDKQRILPLEKKISYDSKKSEAFPCSLENIVF